MSRHIQAWKERWTYNPLGGVASPEDGADDGLDASEKAQLDSEGRPSLQSLNARNILAQRLWWIAGFLSLLAFIIALVRFLTPSTKVWSSCGGDPATARARGCQFDVINFAWQTRECFDAALVAEFAELEPWTFWLTPHGNETVSHEVAYRGERSLWTTHRHHQKHCMWSYRKMHRAYEAGFIEKHLREYSHTLHCSEYVLWEGEEEEGGRFFTVGEDRHLTFLNIVYPVCERLRQGSTASAWWKGAAPR